MNSNNIGVIGLGKLGLTWALILASKGYKVIGIEKNKESVDLLNKGKLTISEDGCDKLFKENIANLSFHNSLNEIQTVPDTIFIVVPSPSLPNERFDSSIVENVLFELDNYLCKSDFNYCNVVVTSTFNA